MKHKKLLLLLIATSIVATPLITLADGLQTVDPFTGTAKGITLTVAIENVVNALLVFAGVIAVIFVIIGGVRYIVSQGDEDAQVTARNTILYAVIGIIVIILSGVIINLIIGSVAPGAAAP